MYNWFMKAYMKENSETFSFYISHGIISFVNSFQPDTILDWIIRGWFNIRWDIIVKYHKVTKVQDQVLTLYVLNFSERT